jgi:hypothetical protein
MMLIQLNPETIVEDVGNHDAESIQKLRGLLIAGAPAKADSQRKCFYEVENCSRVYYIHLCPNGKVLLLAVWPKEAASQRFALGARACASSTL